MSSQWVSIEREIRHSIERSVALAGPGTHGALTAAAPGLARFGDASSLLECLRSHAGTEVERDAILADLVKLARAPGRVRAYARDLLWLALWPGLGGIWHGTRMPPGEEPAELVGVLVDKLAMVIARLDLAGVTRVAGTVIENTRRRFWKELHARRARSTEELDLGVPVDVLALCDGGQEVVEALLDLKKLAGNDVDLVLTCLLGGVTTREAAGTLACSREAAKKRLTRALARIRGDDGEAPCGAGRDLACEPEAPCERCAMKESSDVPDRP